MKYKRRKPAVSPISKDTSGKLTTPSYNRTSGRWEFLCPNGEIIGSESRETCWQYYYTVRKEVDA